MQFAEEWKQIGASSQTQFHTGRGFFTCRRAVPPGAVALSQRSPASDQLVLVLHVTDELVFARSEKLLSQLLLMYAGASVLVLGLSWYWAYLSTIRERNEKQISRSEARLRKLSSELLSAQEDERRRISRELHDQLGQEVTAILLDLQSAARQHEPERTQTLLDRAIANTDHVLKELHEIASRVRPSVLDDLGLEDAVASFLTEYQQRTGIEVEADVYFCGAQLPRRVSENAYRILQESLTNIAKHAQTNRAWVKIEVTPTELRLTVRDEGVGFLADQRDTSRLGILGIHERTELLGGDFRLAAARNEGTRVEVAIPLTGVNGPDSLQEETC